MTKQQEVLKQFCKNLKTYCGVFPLPFPEMIDETKGIFALRFQSFEALEKFFLINFDHFSKNKLSTKVIGKTLFVFPKKGDK